MEQANAQILIRSLRPEEAPTCAGWMANSEPWITLRSTYEGALKAVSDPNREVYIACAGEAPAGVMILNLLGPFSGYVQSLCVSPECRNRGIGRKLIAFAEERIFRESPNVFLCVSSFNTRAQKFYASLGYERVGEFKDYVVRGHGEILMRKSIGSLREFRSSAAPGSPSSAS